MFCTGGDCLVRLSKTPLRRAVERRRRGAGEGGGGDVDHGGHQESGKATVGFTVAVLVPPTVARRRSSENPPTRTNAQPAVLLPCVSSPVEHAATSGLLVAQLVPLAIVW